jgi:hypothetical protein
MIICRIKEAKMASMHSRRGKRTEGGDEENTAFGLPGQVADHKPGFDSAVPKQEAETGNNRRFRPSAKKDIPQQSLAARIGKKQKGG